MKKIVMLLVLIGLLFQGAYAQNMKIGVVDSRLIMSKVKKFKDAQSRLNKEIAKEEQKLSNMKKEVEKMYAELEQQKMILSPEKRKEKEEIVKTMTSSGTSGQAVSRIYLNKETASNQTKVFVFYCKRHIKENQI